MSFSPVTRLAAENEPPQAAKWLEEAFSRHQDELLGMLYHLLGNAEDARDALQNAFINCWKHRDTLEDIENLRAWIFRIALNAGRDLYKTAWRKHYRPLEEGGSRLAAANLRPDADAMHKEQLALIRTAVGDLRPELREIFLLRQNGQLTYEQIAAAVDAPVGTVKTRMRLALSKLREALEGKEGG
jgi:RNA polymerase sigma-70 factor (ECF subfamily)